MYKTLFFLSSALAVGVTTVIECNSGTIASGDILSGLSGAPTSSQNCIDNCVASGCADKSCLIADNMADCSYGFTSTESGIANDGGCVALAGKWTVATQDWSTMSTVTVTFEGAVGLTNIFVGSTAECAAGPAGNPTTCTDGNVCDITNFVKSGKMTDNVLVALDSAGVADLSQTTTTATITANGQYFATGATCTAHQTSQSDCENAGCKWCDDTIATPEGYKGCGVSPSVCQNDGTSSTTSTASTASTSTTTTTTSAGSDSLLSVGFAAMIGAFIFKFM